jgi:hypothetical protein
VATDPISTVGQDAFTQGVTARQQRVDQARGHLAHLQARSVLTDELVSGDLIEAWPGLGPPERRELMHALLEQVVLQRAPRRDPNKPTVADRTGVLLRGGAQRE